MSLSEIEARTRAFYEWERAGRGWQAYEYCVPLEPVFRPYIPETRSARLALTDDARHPTLLSRVVDWFRSPAQPTTETNEPTAEAASTPPPFERVDGLMEWDVLASNDAKVDRALLSHWLQNVAGSHQHISFEVVGFEGRIYVRMAGGERDGRRIREQTGAFFQDVTVRKAGITLSEIWQSANAEIVGAVEFGLAREFMIPLMEQRARTSLLPSLIGALGHLGLQDVAVFQILFERIGTEWNEEAFRSVVTPGGKPFFADAPEITTLASEKCSELLFAACIRTSVATQSVETAEDVLMDVATALRVFSGSDRNELTPLPIEDVETAVADVLDRTTHRSGAILSLSDLLHFIDLPDGSVKSDRLVRRRTRSKAAPATSRDKPFVIGINNTDEHKKEVGLSTEQRLKHCYLIGASGTGKSTLLLNMATQDLRAGNGFAVLDPHGDLVDDILARVPEERISDVIVFDPSDEEFPVGFNILSAHSELERTLLSSDLVAVFRRLSTTFGDQMETVLANAILAFLERPEGGTLFDLRQFLLDKTFRDGILVTVRDREVVSYWKREFPLLKGNPHAPILTRLNGFLRPRIIRNMVAQRNDCLNMRAIMDGTKVLLAKLSQGSIGESNSHLLGSLLVSQIAQAAASRQDEVAEYRTPFFLYLDEFHHFMTPSIASILSGARKYGLGLTLAHQEMRQIKSRNDEVMSAVLGNVYSRFVFRVGEDDARSLATGFSFFQPTDLQNLGTGEAIVRIERPDFDFNMHTVRRAPIDSDLAAHWRARVVAESRRQFSRPRGEVEDLIDRQRGDGTLSPEEGPTNRLTRKSRSSPATEKPAEIPGNDAALPGRGGLQHKYLQSLIRKLGEDRGFLVTVEKRVLDGHGHIDVALERAGLSIACEISVTTRVAHEVGNLTKCLAAQFDHAVFVSTEPRALAEAQTLLADGSKDRLHFLLPDHVGAFLDQFGTQEKTSNQHRASAGKSKSGKLENTFPSDSRDHMSDKKRLIISRDAATYIGLKPQTLAKLRVVGGSPPYFKVGRQVLYDLADLDNWLSDRRQRSTSDVARKSSR